MYLSQTSVSLLETFQRASQKMKLWRSSRSSLVCDVFYTFFCLYFSNVGESARLLMVLFQNLGKFVHHVLPTSFGNYTKVRWLVSMPGTVKESHHMVVDQFYVQNCHLKSSTKSLNVITMKM